MNRYIESGDTNFHPDCNKCKHYIGKAKCKAFTSIIPDGILIGKYEHNKIFNDQIGDFIFELNETDKSI